MGATRKCTHKGNGLGSRPLSVALRVAEGVRVGHKPELGVVGPAKDSSDVGEHLAALAALK